MSRMTANNTKISYKSGDNTYTAVSYTHLDVYKRQPLHRDELPFAKIAADELGRAPPSDNIDEIGLLLLALGLIGAVHRNAETAHRDLRRSVTQLWIRREAAHQAYTV